MGDHTCNSNMSSTYDKPLGPTSDGKGVRYEKERSTWCDNCGGNRTTMNLGEWEAR